MSTRKVRQGGGVDRVGLENILGNSEHPMSGLAYNQSILGGNLLGILPLTEGRFACFFREYSYVFNGSIVQGENRAIVVSTISGNSLNLNLGVEDYEWSSFDVSGEMGYLLMTKNGASKIAVIKSNIDSVSLLSVADVPKATRENGGTIVFGHSVSTGGGRVFVLSVVEQEVYVARVTQANIGNARSWQFLSDNTYRQSNESLRPQQSTKGSLKVAGEAMMVSIGDTQYILHHNAGEVSILKKNRYGAWEQTTSFSAPDVAGDILGFCLVKGAPAYSEASFRYTIPAVFSVAGEPITQQWVKANLN